MPLLLLVIGINGAQFEPIRVAYQEHLKNMFGLLNFHPESSQTYASTVYEMEKALAS